MLRLILVRHGETERNSVMRLQGGKSDVPLNEKGGKQAARLGYALKDEMLTAIYSSPLQRALYTAGAIAGYHSLKVQTVDDLVEINMGAIDGLNMVEIMASHGQFWQRWHQGDCSLELPGGGESLRRVQQRAWAAVQRIIRSHDETSVAIVSHSIVTQTVVLAALDSPLVAFPRFTPGVASINILHIQNNFTTLKVLNDTCHLEGV